MSQEFADAAKSGRAYRTIGEVAERLNLPPHVLRFWETRFSQLRPLKRSGNRRYYRPEDVDLLQAIRRMLYEDGLTIKGVQKRFREQGVKATVASVLNGQSADIAPPATASAPVADPAASTSRAAPSADTADMADSAGSADRAALRRVLGELKALRSMMD